MRQNDLVGILPAVDQLGAVQQGLHYARHVLLMDLGEGDKLPPVGRGRAVAGAAGWRAHVGRATVLVGTGAQLGDMLSDLRSAVVAVVCGEAGAAVERVTALAGTHEAHVVQLGAEPLRVIVSDAGQVSVQAWDAEWRTVSTVVAGAPEAVRKKRRSTTEPLPQPPAQVLVQVAAAQAAGGAETAADTASGAGATGAVPEVAPELQDVPTQPLHTAQPAQEK